MLRHGPNILLNRRRCEAYAADVRADRQASRNGILDRMIVESQILNGHTLDRVLASKPRNDDGGCRRLNTVMS